MAITGKRVVLLEFCCSEKGELLTMRLKILCEDRCEDIAVNLAAACVRSLRRSDQLRSLSESHHVHYMIDVYIVLLYKLKRTQDIFAQVSVRQNIADCRKGCSFELDCQKLLKNKHRSSNFKRYPYYKNNHLRWFFPLSSRTQGSITVVFFYYSRIRIYFLFLLTFLRKYWLNLFYTYNDLK